MTDTLAEQPLVVSVLLGCLAAVLIYAWLQTGKRAAGVLAIVSLLLIPGAWVLASQWQTDREKIEQIIRQTADAIQNNDHKAAVQAIADPNVRSRAMMELPRFVFSMAEVNKIRSISVEPSKFPPTAMADLSVKVDVSTKGGQIRGQRVLRRLELQFEKQGNDWFVTNYRHSPVVGNPDPYTTQFQ